MPNSVPPTDLKTAGKKLRHAATNDCNAGWPIFAAHSRRVGCSELLDLTLGDVVFLAAAV